MKIDIIVDEDTLPQVEAYIAEQLGETVEPREGDDSALLAEDTDGMWRPVRALRLTIMRRRGGS